ncbi:hypothetical protein GOP47_0009492 [Adiantum capillus-veneris]|uniref:Uncharacterized protein n=1 Tax=Adiantum capillus-veneris TaxID=13818 RepID=A0A9D4ZJJ9_ADICA|nr:hypothetical protein GOP47_0009492 [Adiantum capillus-veneris]
MALRTSRPQSVPQDENAQANILSGKVPSHERKGLQQQAPMERKKLSNITNHVLLQPKQASKAIAEKESFAVRADVQDTIPLPTAKKPSRPPLKNISNGTPNPMNNSSSKPPLKAKAELKPQTQSPAFQLPPRSKLNLTEEMKKKAALWAEEGIEKVHFTGEDMEKQRCLIRDREIAKRVAMIRNCRMDIPFPKFSVPCSMDNSTWKPPGDVLELEVVKDLSDDEMAYENEGLNMKIVDEMLGCIDYFTICSPPRFADGWPTVKELEEFE